MFAIVSIHAPREGCDSKTLAYICVVERFQFTHPGRGATSLEDSLARHRVVSIHAPREGCDLFLLGHQCRYAVSIHAPREGCDQEDGYPPTHYLKFQFTHPGRGATKSSVIVSDPP